MANLSFVEKEKLETLLGDGDRSLNQLAPFFSQKITTIFFRF